MTNRSGGFTIIEILVTMVIIVLLLTLGVAGMRGVQASARDQEREADIAAIARGLEARYKQGNPFSPAYPAGTYPGNNEFYDYAFWSAPSLDQTMPGTPSSAVISPSGLGINSFCFFYFWTSNCPQTELESNLQTAFSDGSGGYKDIYLYEFLSGNGTYCNIQACRAYNLWWISETDKTVYKGIPGLKVYRSKNK